MRNQKDSPENINHNMMQEETVEPIITGKAPKGLLGKLRYNRKWQLGIGLAVLLLAAAGLVFALTSRADRQPQPANEQPTMSPQPSQSPRGAQSLFQQQYGRNCEDRDVAFTSAPMRQNELAYIRPLGAVNDGHVTPTDHVYIGGPNPQAADNTYPVLMPADGKVTHVAAMPAQYIGDRNQQTAAEDHRLVISHSCRYYSIYIHIHKLSDALVKEVGKLQPNEHKETNITLKAGEVVGYIGGSTFDWTPIDTSVKLKGFITPSLYEGESWKIHTVSPFDLYKEPLKSQLEAKSLRSVAPIGGKIDYDQPGKLIGNWFREGSGGYSGQQGNNGGRYWDGHLSVVPDYIDPASTIVSIGNWTNNAAKQFVVTGKVDPAAVTAETGLVKYELQMANYVTANGERWNQSSAVKGLKLTQNGNNEGTILLQVMAGEKLKVEKFPGKKASQVAGFTDAAQMYSR